MAKHVSFGEPENESERMAFEYLRDHLPDTYMLYTNLEIRQGQEIYEIDMILLSPYGVFVTDVKDWRGRIELFTTSWDCNGQSRYSPLKKLRNHAKVLSTLICDNNRALYQQLRQVHIQASVLLTADDVRIIDRANFDSQHVTYLDRRCLEYFQGDRHIPPHRLKNIQRYVTNVDRAIRHNAYPRSAPRQYQKWQVIEPPYEKNDRKGYIGYRVKDTTLGSISPIYQLRVYELDPLLSADERSQQTQLISNAFQALKQIRSHDYILPIEDFSPHEGNQFLLVTDEASGQPLDHHIQRQDLSLEQKLDIIGEVLRALEHIHKRGVIHRNLTPETIWITPEGRARLTGFDFARITDRTITIAEQITEELAEDILYQAPECQNNPAQVSVTSDLFAAGVIFYELLTGTPAFTDVQQMHQPQISLPTRPSEAIRELSTDFDGWLQTLCAYEPNQRFATATDAIAAFPPLPTPSIDVTDLQPGTILDDLYEVVCRLGNPGKFAVAYKVLEIRSGKACVMKLVNRGRSVYERVIQEYRTLNNIKKHQHIVVVRHSGDLRNGIPFIIFEYVEGRDVQQLIKAGELSLEQAVQIAKQTASGLNHLHNQEPKVFHQDIKPLNLVMTKEGIRIIDFNIAVMAGEEITINAFSRPYLPPESQLRPPQSDSEKRDRDLYALGIVLYECVTGGYPFNTSQPPIGQPPLDPREFPGCEDLSPELVQIMLKAIAPERNDRFPSADAFLQALENLPRLRQSDLLQKTISTEPVKAERLVVSATPVVRETVAVSKIPLPDEEATYIPIPSKAKFDLFDTQWLRDNCKPNPNKPIVLDPTGCYEPTSPDYIPIETEGQWLKFFGQNEAFYWVRGQGRRDKLCEWTQQWLRVRGQEHLIEIKEAPREKLSKLFRSIPIPASWSDRELLVLANQLDRYPQDDPIAYLLADVTDSDLQIWTGHPSISHLAAWLGVLVPEECKILEQVWQNRFAEHELAAYYLTNDKIALLRQWVGIAELGIPKLEDYPLTIPDFLLPEFERYWEQQLYRSEAGVLDTLSFEQLPGKEHIAARAYKVLSQRPNWCTQVREDKLAPYLNLQQRQNLRDRKPPTQPAPLPLDADVQQAVTWVTQQYFQFRRWEVGVLSTPREEQISDHLAESFVDWMLHHYPNLVSIPVAESPLNYNVTSQVQALCQQQPVLWVVVDGLGWLDHLELLSYLQEQGITSEIDIQPRLSILPTVTGYAKWSLYSQCLPSHTSWRPNAGKGFPKTDLGRRYTDEQKTSLLRDLRKGKNRLYCWDTIEFDKLFHKSGDWQHLYYTTRPNALRSLAAEICSLVNEFPDSDQLRVVIASDHGQMIGELVQISPCPSGLEPQGRAAIGKTDDPRFVVLQQACYALPHEMSVVRGAASLGGFISYTNQSVIGSHGGLFPEEVVVGVSVLRKSTPRSRVLVFCQGEGRPRETGDLVITIDNPNPLAIEDLWLQVKELPSLSSGTAIQQIVPANDRITFKIPTIYPELPPGLNSNRLSLSGTLTYRYRHAETSTVSLDDNSAIVINQIFSSGLDIDEFL